MRAPLVLAGCLLAPALAAAQPAPAVCPVVGLRLEEEIAKAPQLREPANEQTVRDLRTLRDAGIVLDAFGYPAECARVAAILRELLDNPRKAIGQGGDTDEDKAEAIEEARSPKAGTKK
ncbi:photosystem reaction center subunit H [Methylobacterium isbiliense]|jgi:hypothetical protein|uniref:Photosystem reaction center subunit H n=1 Tax=Methylobacterium isbiliense TaxID=315478 RepID=A0ABQ4SG84_9HYPH|nr:photosystem reaction center subunit H [Methylobacterium isbiliense]MDN3624317.1 photosystem reaction center subunit H [Methylobacterium isbiliense]GJE01408.1 hypothetical protein GMJLKIPL_3338 [Methylobacterium isbiliense]